MTPIDGPGREDADGAALSASDLQVGSETGGFAFCLPLT